MSEVDNSWTKSLPFDKTKQSAVLGHLLTNYNFFMQARGVIEPNWFQDVYAQKTWREAVRYFAKYKRIPSQPELMDWGEIKIEEPNVKRAINSCLVAAFNDVQFFGLDAIKDELTAWLHSAIYWENIHDSVNLFNKDHFQLAFEKLKATSKKIDSVTFENDLEADFSNYAADMNNLESDIDGALTFGCPGVDLLLAPDIADKSRIKGGLIRKDTTVLLAPANIGKSSCMITVLGHNLRQGKHVLFLTHEGREADIKQKIWCSLLKCTKQDLITMCNTPEGRKRFEKGVRILKENLTYIHLVKAGLTVEEVESVIRRKTDEKIARTGKGYDLMVDDYPAILTSCTARKGELGKRHIDGLVYGYFVALADELGAHALVAIQTNRTGSKINKKQEGENRLLTMEDVAESWDVMCRATNVITLNRDKDAERNNRIIYYIDKSRSNSTGWAVVCQTEYAKCLTHAPWMSYTYYRGADNPGDRLYEMVQANDGREISYQVIKDIQNDSHA